MKPFCICCLVLLAAGSVWSGEEMTPTRFRELVATAGDTNALRPELTSLPFWTNAICGITMKYEDGKVFNEDCVQTAKTIGGKYIVFSMDSHYYKQTMYAIAEYDDNALAIRDWGLYGDTLTGATMVFDPGKKVSASTSRYGDFEEISVGHNSDSEMSDHTLVYKNGRLFMTRDVTTRPIRGAGDADRSQPVPSPTNGVGFFGTKEAREFKQIYDDLRAVTAEWYRMKGENLLPGVDKDSKLGDVSFYPAYEAFRKSDWYKLVEKDYGKCQRAYFGMLKVNGRDAVYLFCMDTGSPRLVVATETRNGGAYPIYPVETSSTNK
jgi:hypothetical protein